MRSKLALSALVIASLLGANAMASAQTQPPAAGASTDGTADPGAAKMKKSSKKSKTAMKKKGAAAPADSGAGSDSK